MSKDIKEEAGGKEIIEKRKKEMIEKRNWEREKVKIGLLGLILLLMARG